jgi:hypothetical protein
MILKQKKGELTDIMIFMITLFILAVGFFIIIYVIPSITEGLRTAGLNNTVDGANAINSLDDLGNTVNYGFLMLFVGLVISVFITSFLVRSHPIFLFLYIFFLAITLFVGVYIGNTYYTYLETNTVFASTSNTANFINLVMNHIVEITLAVGALSMIIVFAKFNSGGSGQQF